MILVLLGTQPFSFSRLLDQLLCAKEAGYLNTEQLVIQSGQTTVPKGLLDAQIIPFMDRANYLQCLDEAQIVISHGGAGSVFDTLRRNKPLIVLPRKQDLGEHLDDHQQELVDILKAKKFIISENTISESFKILPAYQFTQYISGQQQVIEQLKFWIDK